MKSPRRFRIRALPAAAIVLAFLFGLKLAGFTTFGLAFASDTKPDEAAHDKPAADHAATDGAPPSDSDAHKESSPGEEAKDNPACEPTISEAGVLESLSDRREKLDARERELDLREKSIQAIEKRVEERVAEVKSIEAHVEEIYGQRDAATEAHLASLVKTYEAMKPADAAQIFNTLDLGVLIDVIGRMKPAKVAPILAAMDPVRAQEVTIMLARRDKLAGKQTVPAKTADQPTVAPASAPAPAAAPAVAKPDNPKPEAAADKKPAEAKPAVASDKKPAPVAADDGSAKPDKSAVAKPATAEEAGPVESKPTEEKPAVEKPDEAKPAAKAPGGG